MKRIILVIFMIILGFTGISAQTISRSILKSGTWNLLLKYPSSFYTTENMRCTGSTIYEDSYYHYHQNKHKNIIVYKYYLSDKMPRVFDKNKVGKIAKGRYIVMYNETAKSKGDHGDLMSGFKVIKVTNYEISLMTCYIPKDNVGCSGDTFIYKRINIGKEKNIIKTK